MILHDVSYLQFDIKNEDTLERPQHRDLKFEAVVANPPFSADWSANPLLMNDDRYSQFGKLAPKGTADFAFVQHMYYQLADNGIMATVLPHGVLFRGAAEEHIRKHFIEELNAIDAVIGLPANLFYGTSIATCILVLKKCREDNEHILFIDASKDFDKQKTQNYLLTEHIDRIVSTYQQRKADDKYAHLAMLDEVRGNNYNLNIPRYVNTFAEQESIDLDTISDELVQINTELAETEKSILAFCKELGIRAPF